jgi:hypothetical protein
MKSPSNSHLASILGFFAGAGALGLAFVLAVVSAVTRSTAPHGAPSATDYRFGVGLLLLLTAGFAVTVTTRGAGARPRPSGRDGFVAGLGATALLLITLMFTGEAMGMAGGLVVAGLLGAAAALAVRRIPTAGRLRAARI